MIARIPFLEQWSHWYKQISQGYTDINSASFNFFGIAHYKILRTELIAVVHQSGLFNAESLAKFNLSRRDDSSYAIHAGDSTIINVIKCIYNLVATLELIQPSLLQPLTEYFHAEEWWGASLNYATFLAHYLYQRTRLIKDFKFQVRNLNYYLNELTADVSSLTNLNNTLVVAIVKIADQLGHCTQPLLKHIKILQLGPDHPHEHVEKAAEAMPTLAKLVKIKNKGAMNKISVSIDDFKQRIETLLTKRPSTANADSDASVKTTINPTTKNLFHLAQTLSRVQSALQKIDLTISRQELHVVDVCSDLGAAIKELQQINIESVQQITAVEVQKMFVTIIESIEPLFYELICNLEMMENHWNLSTQALEDYLTQIYNNYAVIAKTVDVQFQRAFPYMNKRLEWRKQVLAKLTLQQLNVRSALQLVKHSTITSTTSLKQLLQARQAANVIGTPNTYYYVKEINRIIGLRTGLSALNLNIEKLEKNVRLNKDNQTDLQKLPKLYALRHEIETRCQTILAEQNTGLAIFAYDPVSNAIQPMHFHAAHLSQLWHPTESKIARPLANTIKTAEQQLEGLDSKIEKLTARVNAAEDIIIMAIGHLQSPLLQAYIHLKKEIEDFSPFDLYDMPLHELQSFLNEMQLLPTACTREWMDIIEQAILDRAGLADLNGEIQLAQHEIQKEKQYLVFYQEKLQAADKLSIEPITQLLTSSVENFIAWIKQLNHFEELSKTIKAHLNQPQLAKELTKHTYQEGGLNRFMAARDATLQFIRQQCLPDVSNVDEEQTKAKPAQPKIQQDLRLANAAPDAILTNIENRFKGLLVTNSEAIRHKVSNLIGKYFNSIVSNSFQASRQTSDKYYVVLADPIFIKITKSILNVMRQLEEVAIRIQPHLRNLSAGKGHLACALSGLPATHAACLALEIECRDLGFYLREILTISPNLFSLFELPLFRELQAMINPMLGVGQDLFNLLDLSGLIKHDLTSQLVNILNGLNLLVQSQPTTKYDVAFGPLNTLIQSMDDFIESRYGIKRKPDGLFKTKLAGNNRDLRDLLNLANTLSTVVITLHGLVGIADDVALKEMFIIASSLYGVYRRTKQLYTSRNNEIRSAIIKAMANIHPMLINIAARMAVTEIKLGITPGLMTKPVGRLCIQFEKAAENLGININNYYPYACETLTMFTADMEQEQKKHAQLALLLKLLQQNDSKKVGILSVQHFSLADFVKLRDLLRLLPPSLTHGLISAMESAIQNRTGLNSLNNVIRVKKNHVASVETKLAALQQKLMTTKHDTQLAQQETNKLQTYIQTLRKPRLSAQNISDLYSAYVAEPSLAEIDFKDFCHVLYFQRGVIVNHFNTRIALCDTLVNIANLSAQETQNDLTKTQQNLSQLKHELLEKHALAVQLTQLINLVNAEQTLVKEYKYYSDQLIPNAFNLNSILNFSYSDTLFTAIQQHMTLQEHKIQDMQTRYAELEKNHQVYVNKLMLDHQQTFESLEKHIKLKPGSLTSLLPQDQTDLRENTKIVHALKNIRGVIVHFLSQYSKDDANNYAAILNKPMTQSSLIEDIAKEASKTSSQLGRFLRRLVGKSKPADEIYQVVKYYPKQISALQLSSHADHKEKEDHLKRELANVKSELQADDTTLGSIHTRHSIFAPTESEFVLAPSRLAKNAS